MGTKRIAATLFFACMVQAEPVLANSETDELSAYIQCAPYAREVSGIEIYGDARTWWAQAQVRYETGNQPRQGAVMAFRPHRSMQLGHVATVSRVLDSRRVLLDHANWSPVDGKRGQVEKDVLAMDVSPGNDWSEVRVWYAPIGDVGQTRWPIDGFIYADERRAREITPRPRIAVTVARPKTSQDFLSAFADYSD
ncbi:CHAP domain-containing protein [Qipengyuania seohaensis]|uniref:CHAP domain-containing protein n=1 Tax=Qipengyuania seohaensis TaxID=266951 RepID=UPI000C22639C|nr:CHAP domain-containing protein [Qipengyuania seohaensis]